MRESMAQLTPRFAASRTVSEYTEQYYLPAAVAFRARAADKGALAKEWVESRNTLASKHDRGRGARPETP
jgi:starch phosphorylase